VRGKTIEKARYPHPDEAATQLYAWIDRARNAEQVVGRLLQALIAAHVADQEAVAVSSRVYWNAPGQYDDGPSSDIPAMLDRLAKSVLPRRDGEAAAADEKAKAA
jgi:hypothetical protein